MRLKEFLKDGGNVNSIDSQWNSMSIADRTNYIKGDLLRRGYTQNQTAAILGNLLQENRSLHTHTANASSGALGIAQWLGGRKKAIISQGKHSTITGQLDFLDSEIRGKGAWTNNVGGKNAFFSSDDPRELTYIFRKDFERPGEHEANDNKRLANTFQVLGKAYTPTQQYDYTPIGIPEDMKPVSFDDVKTQVAKNPEMIQFFDPNVQSQIEESFRLDNEKQRQDQIKSEYEYQNQQIQMALQEKQKQREQILSMIPQSAFVGSSGNQGSSLKLMQKGGWVPFSARGVNPENIRSFYQDMISAPWYKERLEANGYDSKLNPGNWFSDGAQDEVDYRLRRVNHTRVNKIDKTKLPYSVEENERYKQLDQYGIHWDNRKNEINYQLNDIRLDYVNAEPYEVMTHEFGHPESTGRLNSYESGLLTDRLSNRTKDDHDRSPEENKADINTLRYNLYRKGLYDPKTGKYKTKSGKFDNSLLKNVNSNFIIKRLQQNYNPADLEFLVNTIAYNEPQEEQPTYAQKGGKVVSELWKEKTGTDWSEAKRLGLTDGSYSKNIQLLSRLRNNDPELINAVPQEVVQQQQQTPQQPRLTFNDLPNNLIPDVDTNIEYYSWAKDKQAVTDSNTSLNQLEREGHVELIKGKDNKIKTDVNGNYLYKILTNEYKDTFNNWIKTLNTKDTPQEPVKKEVPKKQEKPNGFLSSIQGLISDFANSTDQTLDEVGNTISEGASDVKDLFQQAYNYADRHFLDNTEVNTKKLVATKQPTIDSRKPTHVFEDQINMTDIEVGKGKAASGIINLNSNKFVTRNRGDHSEVKGGKGIAVTLFNPMNKDLDNSYKQFPEVMALKKDGSIEIMARDKVTKDKVESITRADRMPWDKLEVVERNGKQYVKVEDSPDFKGKVVSMGGYNSGLGVGKWDKDYVPIDEANKYSKLIGGKVVMKSGDQEILVTGSFKDMYDAYKTLEKKTKQKPVVYKLDNGSFNTTYFKDNNMIDSEDLREHQNRNRAGGHALILLNK